MALRQIEECPSQAELIDFLWKHFQNAGFNGFAFMIPSPTDPLRMIHEWRGFPEAYVTKYLANDLHLIDPFPAVVARHANAMRFSEISRFVKLNAAQSAYLKDAEKAGVTDGLKFSTQRTWVRLPPFCRRRIESSRHWNATESHCARVWGGAKSKYCIGLREVKPMQKLGLFLAFPLRPLRPTFKESLKSSR